MAKGIGLKEIARTIATERLHSMVSLDVVYDVLKTTLSEITYNLLHDIPITVKNFGTLGIYVFKGHRAGFWGDKIQETLDTKRVRFYPSQSFLEIIDNYRDDLKK